ncbi:hypothetical protein DAPPUDRAFT_331467 [Daphnia pulex]|uniref:Uncharacterized protein n=1 Tax=Daphnia pulex TaxID=6669 RepID=E9HMK0_DAPPU|nr:hypothetical protein DAPPUDRAFT_331467 [Daphnia pulex]|eukprot:EFX67043.1 hypothetical protein DAPPUDRAFT_331467 [Daphnia pulex]
MFKGVGNHPENSIGVALTVASVFIMYVVYWNHIQMLPEFLNAGEKRQSLYIEKKSQQLVSLLNTAPKKECVKVSQVVSQLVQEIDIYEEESKFH